MLYHLKVGAVELCDEVMVHAMNSYSDMTLPTTSPLLLFKFSGRSKIQVREDIKVLMTRYSYFYNSQLETSENVVLSSALHKFMIDLLLWPFSQATAEICRKYKSGEFVWCSKASERDRLWNARKHA